MGPSLIAGVNGRVWNENIYNCPAKKKKFKTQTSARKTMLRVFRDSQGPVLEHYQKRGTTINSARYSEMLTDRLKPAIEANSEVYCGKMLCCCTTMTVHILLSTLLKRSRNSSLK